MDLFLDFVNIFRELLMILGMNEVGAGPQARFWGTLEIPKLILGGWDSTMGTGAAFPAVTAASPPSAPLAEQEEGEEMKLPRVQVELSPPRSPSPPRPRPFSGSLKGFCACCR